jgi:AcrR family transcriptional regulator
VTGNAERGRATRERVIRAATELFAARGFDGTSTEAVLKASGVSRGSLYHHFANKEALFRAVLTDLQARLGADLAAVGQQAGEPIAAMRAGALEWLRMARDPVVRQIMLIDGPAVLGWRAFRELDEAHTLGGIRMALSWAAQAGRIPAEHVDVFAHIALATVNELAIMIATADDPEQALRAGQSGVDEFLRRLLGD